MSASFKYSDLFSGEEPGGVPKRESNTRQKSTGEDQSSSGEAVRDCLVVFWNLPPDQLTHLLAQANGCGCKTLIAAKSHQVLKTALQPGKMLAVLYVGDEEEDCYDLLSALSSQPAALNGNYLLIGGESPDSLGLELVGSLSIEWLDADSGSGEIIETIQRILCIPKPEKGGKRERDPFINAPSLGKSLERIVEEPKPEPVSELVDQLLPTVEKPAEPVTLVKRIPPADHSPNDFFNDLKPVTKPALPDRPPPSRQDPLSELMAGKPTPVKASDRQEPTRPPTGNVSGGKGRFSATNLMLGISPREDEDEESEEQLPELASDIAPADWVPPVILPEDTGSDFEDNREQEDRAFSITSALLGGGLPSTPRKKAVPPPSTEWSLSEVDLPKGKPVSAPPPSKTGTSATVPVAQPVPTVSESGEKGVAEAQAVPSHKEQHDKSVIQFREQKSRFKLVRDPNTPLYDWLITQIANQWSEVSKGTPLDLALSYELASALVCDILSEESHLETRAMSRHSESGQPFKILNMAIFGVMIGRRLEIHQSDLEIVAVAGLVHDLGMALIPRSILEKTENFTAEDVRIVREHPAFVKKLVENSQGVQPVNPKLIEAVYRIHERINGKGYPDGMVGNFIPIHARILAVANTFAAFSHPRHYKRTFVAAEAVQEVTRLSGKELDTDAVKALVKELTPFPINSFVVLNNGEIGSVAKINKKQPLRPIVEVLFSAGKVRLPYPRKVDLTTSTSMFIIQPIQERDLPEPL